MREGIPGSPSTSARWRDGSTTTPSSGTSGLESRKAQLQGLPGRIASKIARGVTLSTMHGCPPHEIEAICRYMLEEKSLNTFVKLNPTLLGYDRVREILDACGFGYLTVRKESFAHDLPLAEAKSMLRRLLELSREKRLSFGVKLTNTLGAVNAKGVLPGDEFYVSGRALFPLSINVAAVLSREFDGELPVSYSGGASLFNIKDIFETGIRPITMCTDLLKPGGYLRLLECAKELDRSDAWPMTRIDVARLEALAAGSLTAEYTQKSWRPKDVIDAGGALPLTDCYVAPCVSACAIHQDIPEYIHLLAEERYADALDVIYRNNALPAITGHICDHQCQTNCTRLDYDSPLKIRDLKKVALERGWAEYRSRWHKPAGTGSRHPVAVIGMGPAGLSAGYFLARAGHPVTLFEREAHAGGVCGHIVPRFRLPEELVRHDIDFVAEHGVKFEYGCDPALTVDELRAQGFEYVLIGIGADKSSGIRLEGTNARVAKSLDFLRRCNRGETLDLGAHVAVVGAGNTAMDCARAALRVPGVKDVTVIYRRSRDEVPAFREEYDEAVEDGVKFRFLTNPERFEADGSLTCRVMALGAPDEKGRRRPLATDQTVTLKMDALITAIGEQADADALRTLGVPLDDKGLPIVDLATGETARSGVFLIGDVQKGPVVDRLGHRRREARDRRDPAAREPEEPPRRQVLAQRKPGRDRCPQGSGGGEHRRQGRAEGLRQAGRRALPAVQLRVRQVRRRVPEPGQHLRCRARLQGPLPDPARRRVLQRVRQLRELLPLAGPPLQGQGHHLQPAAGLRCQHQRGLPGRRLGRARAPGREGL